MKNDKWYFDCPEYISGKAKWLIDFINLAKKHNIVCNPLVKVEGFVLDENHYNFVIKVCNHCISGDCMKVRRMCELAVKNNTDENGVTHHSGLEAVAGFYQNMEQSWY